MKKNLIALLASILCVLLLAVDELSAAPPRNPAFYLPQEMRPRVEFWIDIFTRYGKNQTVLHHRDYPHVIFKVLDYSDQAGTMSPVALELYRKKDIKREIAYINGAFTDLAKGRSPADDLQKSIALRMRALPGTAVSNYKRVLRDGLIRTQTGIREKYMDAIRRSGRYIRSMEYIFVKEHGLPVELTRLPFVESSFDYKAYSSAGAAGIWQFMPRTGRVYLKINSSVDERRDPIKATHAAAEYLKYGYKKLGTWPLALTAYNHGVYGVAKKVKKMGTSNIAALVEHPSERVFGFASNNFYAEFLAALQVYDNINRYFPGLRPDPPKHFAVEELKFPITVKYASQQLGLSVNELEDYNYSLLPRVWRGVYPIPKGYELKVPVSHSSRLIKLHTPDPKLRGSGVSSSPIYGGVKYRVRRGDTLLKVARRYNTTVKQLKQLNGLHSDLLRVGQVLAVKIPENKSMPKASAPTAAVSAGGYYRVKSGDTLSRIAKRHGTSVSALKSANGLRSDSLRVGQLLKISGKSSGTIGKHRTYTVRKGDNLWSISNKFGVSVSAVKKANAMRSNKLYVGQKLKIP